MKENLWMIRLCPNCGLRVQGRISFNFIRATTPVYISQYGGESRDISGLLDNVGGKFSTFSFFRIFLAFILIILKGKSFGELKNPILIRFVLYLGGLGTTLAI